MSAIRTVFARPASALGLAALVSLASTPVAAGRQVVALDGTWQLAAGELTNAPSLFDRRAPVPGLVDLAKPLFEEPALRAVKGFAPGAFWYRRTFTLPKALPGIGILRVGQSQYGIRVLVNGEPAGERTSGWVPMQFDVRRFLRPGPNEICIRVATFPVTPPGNYMPPVASVGWDAEKVMYTPGLSDSVDLLLAQPPFVRLVQVVPDVTQRAAVVHAWLRGVPVDGAAVKMAIRESRSGKAVAEATAQVAADTNGEAHVVARIPIPDGRLWTPEDPFLYTVQVSTPSDQCETRFGLRSFHLDPQTGRALLNGKPYYLRGSNVCIYRFFDDPERADLPWDAAWVRRLHRQFKDMHWNSLRYCIGLPPQQWYDIADEEGFLIQDEYPIWDPNRPLDVTAEALAEDYRAMMESHWNHPSVAIWDACNETRQPVTGEARDRVRGLDLSDRPWENGWSRSTRPTDAVEDHPYHYLFTQNPDPRLPLLKTANPGAGAQAPQWKPGRSPVIVNEYGGLWLNRDGSPTVLTRELYPRLLGTNATAAQRRHLHALYLAADTEFFRSHRQLAGVLEFCALGYSRPDGATSDHWAEHGVASLKWDPDFQRYVRDAFAPVGLMVEFWNGKVVGGSRLSLPVRLVNDLDKPWNGPVTLRVKKGNRTLCESSQQAALEPLGAARITFDLTWPESVGPCTLEASLHGADGQPVASVRELEILDARPLGIAAGRPATASSLASANFEPQNAVDGDPATYWSSEFKDGAWLAVDLGDRKMIRRVTIRWENAFAKAFVVEVSDDGQAWRSVYKNEAGQGGLTDFELTPTSARWIRLTCNRRGTEWGNAVYEMRVYE